MTSAEAQTYKTALTTARDSILSGKAAALGSNGRSLTFLDIKWIASEIDRCDSIISQSTRGMMYATNLRDAN